jgi:RNA polymerase sigma-70 factor (ECF subfamily)
MLTQRTAETVCRDTDLLEMIRNNDLQAFDMLYKKYWRPLLHYAAQYLDDAAACEEIVQELFVHLHGRHAPINIRSSVSSYLYTATRNRILNHVRNRAVYKKHISQAVGSTSEVHNNVEQFISFVELRNEIARSLGRMPARYREVYMLHDEHHYTIKKIASVLNRPVDTVEKQLRKALSLLRDHLTVARLHA